MDIYTIMEDKRILRFATFLSPVLYETYQAIADYVGGQLNCPTTLHVGQRWEEFAAGEADVGFLCGLPFARMTALPAPPIEPLAAPVVSGKRYQGRPIYYSDIVVHADSPYACLDDLPGCVWAYNERASHSGYNIVSYTLLLRGQTAPFFGRMVETGSHLNSLLAVLTKRADATAIDSHALAVWRAAHPVEAERIRIIEMFGPSPIPPVAVAARLDAERKRRIQEALLAMHNEPSGASALKQGLIERFVPVGVEEYTVLLEMQRRVEKTMEA